MEADLDQSDRPKGTPRVCVLAPAPLLTVTVESHQRAPEEPPVNGSSGSPGASGSPGSSADDVDEAAEVHLHAGGQGFWVARMIAELGSDVVFCATFGGETGRVVQGLLATENLTVRGVDTAGANGSYLHDRRTGERQPLVTVPSGALSRHEVDDLFNLALVEGLESDLCLLGGPDTPRLLPADTYRRLAADFTANGVPVVIDLSGDQLAAALAGGVAVVKVSHEELLRDGRAEDDRVGTLVDAMRALVADGAGTVAVTRAEEHALALLGDDVVEIVGPTIEPADSKGAGDSFTAGLTAALAAGSGLEAALRLAVAAGSLNVSRHGLGSGDGEHIQRLAAHVELRPLRL